MKRTLTILLGVFLFASPAQSFDWSKVAARLQESVFQLRNFDNAGYCSGWVIDNDRDFAITAEHCVSSHWAQQGGIFVDGIETLLVQSSVDTDYAVLWVPGIDRKELKPSKKAAKVGQDIGVFGFSYGFRTPQFRAGNISAVGQEIEGDEEAFLGVWTVTDQTYISGQSGGPVVDTDGKALAMIQHSNFNIGIGKSIEEIYAATKTFWKR